MEGKIWRQRNNRRIHIVSVLNQSYMDESTPFDFALAIFVIDF